MRGAIEIARYFTAHMLALYGAEDLSPEADAVLKVLRRCGVERLSQNDVRMKVKGMRRLERADDVALVLAELMEARFIEPCACEPALQAGREDPEGLLTAFVKTRTADIDSSAGAGGREAACPPSVRRIRGIKGIIGN